MTSRYAMGETMADLNTMRDVLAHWQAYQADEQELQKLCTRQPVDCASIQGEDRTRCMYLEPSSYTCHTEALSDAIAASAVRMDPPAGSGSSWGWWLEDAEWQAIDELRRSLEALDATRAAHAAFCDEANAVVAADEAYAELTSTIDAYTAADAEDRAALAECQELRSDPEHRQAADEDGSGRGWTRVRIAASVLVIVAGLAAWACVPDYRGVIALCVSVVALLVVLLMPLPPKGGMAPWRRHRINEGNHVLDQKIAEIEAKIELRARELKELGEQRAARLAALLEPYRSPREKLEALITRQEHAAIEVLDGDLVKRDDAYEAGSLGKLPFDEALAAGNEREWQLLEAWMDAYIAELPHAMEHAENVLGTEALWLEGHAPYGRRNWPDTPEIVRLMEEGSARDSDAALALVSASAR